MSNSGPSVRRTVSRNVRRESEGDPDARDGASQGERRQRARRLLRPCRRVRGDGQVQRGAAQGGDHAGRRGPHAVVGRQAGRLGEDGAARVIDGPFAEAKELVGGFWIWQVSSMDEAVQWLKRAPFKGASVELRRSWRRRTSRARSPRTLSTPSSGCAPSPYAGLPLTRGVPGARRRRPGDGSPRRSADRVRTAHRRAGPGDRGCRAGRGPGGRTRWWPRSSSGPRTRRARQPRRLADRGRPPSLRGRRPGAP